MESTRLKKVTSMLERDLAEIFRQFAKTHTKGVLVSVSGMRITPDLGLARVKVSIFPTESVQAVMPLLDEHVNHFRHELGKKNRNLRKIPELFFHLDDSLDYIENIDRLLNGEGENPIKWNRQLLLPSVISFPGTTPRQ